MRALSAGVWAAESVSLAQSDAAGQENTERAALSGSVLAPPLFDEEMTHGRFAHMLEQGWSIKSTKLSATFDWPQFVEQHGRRAVLMFGVEEKGALRVASSKRELQPKPGWTVLVLVPPVAAETPAPEPSFA